MNKLNSWTYDDNYIQNLKDINFLNTNTYDNSNFKNKFQENNFIRQDNEKIDILKKKSEIEIEYEKYKEISKQFFINNSFINKTKKEYFLPYNRLLKIFISNFIVGNKSILNNKKKTGILNINEFDLIILNLFQQKK